MSDTVMPNRLIHEASPYLRQHACNPVDWYPWGEEALHLARQEDKPIFLSIGYSACHWCHVMEHESFREPSTAAVMNELFVNIKVDREERPDLDRIYMTAVQMMTGSGGWPMSVFLTPELAPFFAGTYFPPKAQYGRPSFRHVLEAVADAYRNRSDEIDQGSKQLVERLQELSKALEDGADLTETLLDEAVRQLTVSFDPENGGFGGAPKFPQVGLLRLLMRQQCRMPTADLLPMVRLTLDKMADGGIRDHIGGGFHRYATDARWLIPHFEKMLYDNAQLAIVYLEAYQLTGRGLYREVARETLDYLVREMAGPEGGFFASQDADSEDGEGFFYSWTIADLRDALDEEDAELFALAYDVDQVGNFEGRTILHRVKSDAELSSRFGLPETEIGPRLQACRKQLRRVRESRSKPFRDEKVLLDWNGLVLSAFSLGSRVLEEDRYTEIAENCAGFLLSKLRDPDGQLVHAWFEQSAGVPGFLEDHAGVLLGLLDLFEATGHDRWLEEAIGVRDATIDRFWDEASGSFHDTSADQRDLIVQTRNPGDGAIPSGNGLAATALIRLGRLTGHDEDERRAVRILESFSAALQRMPTGVAQLLMALDLHLAEPSEIVIVGPRGDSAVDALHRVVNQRFLPHTLLVPRPDGPVPFPNSDANLGPFGHRPAAYLCSSFSCRNPATTPEELAATIAEAKIAPFGSGPDLE